MCSIQIFKLSLAHKKTTKNKTKQNNKIRQKNSEVADTLKRIESSMRTKLKKLARTQGVLYGATIIDDNCTMNNC